MAGPFLGQLHLNAFLDLRIFIVGGEGALMRI
jgi:hypothetical protein